MLKLFGISMLTAAADAKIFNDATNLMLSGAWTPDTIPTPTYTPDIDLSPWTQPTPTTPAQESSVSKLQI